MSVPDVIVMPGPTEDDELEATLYDAIGHLEAAAAKLGLCATTARPPRSVAFRAWQDELDNIIENARAEHTELMTEQQVLLDNGDD